MRERESARERKRDRERREGEKKERKNERTKKRKKERERASSIPNDLAIADLAIAGNRAPQVEFLSSVLPVL